MSLTIKGWDYHRNGVAGNGFYAVLFTDSQNRQAGLMVASLFSERGNCAVYSVPMLSAEEGVKFAQNSWRGDDYANLLRPMLRELFGRELFS